MISILQILEDKNCSNNVGTLLAFGCINEPEMYVE
jgi:hypothetical protein